MAPLWAFYPHPGGKKRRGLQVGGDGDLWWAACRTDDTRSVSIYLPGPPDAKLAVEKTSVVQVSYGTIPLQGFYPVNVKSVGPGTSYISAQRGSEICSMDVTVFPKLPLHLAFKRVETERWKSNLTIGKMQRLVENLNYIYSYQGNLTFTALGTPQKETIPGLADVVPTDIVSDWSARRNSGADATIFFVKETDALAVNWSDLIIMEDSQTRPWDEMTCAHELGHRVNLRHPNPSIPFNLMNQTGVGDRDRMKIFLTRTQIETITVKSNWKGILNSSTDADTCAAPR